jgi:hypothetical protein
MNFEALDFTSRWYENCKRQRKVEAKICGDCPFRTEIEQEEQRRLPHHPIYPHYPLPPYPPVEG